MRLIDADAIIEEYCGDCAYRGTELCEDNVPACGTAGWIKDAPTVDAVKVCDLEAWLYEIAINNTYNYLSNACEEIISRLDGLRMFAKERKQHEML